MADTQNPEIGEEVQQLLDALNSYHLAPDQMEEGFKDFSDASKNEAAARVARTLNPPPPGRLLTRLLFIRTGENDEDITAAFIANLHSPELAARLASLYGLEKLGHPALTDFALASLHDDSDRVLTAACNILLPRAKQDSRIMDILKELYATHKGKPEFHLSMSTLEAHLFQ